MKKLLGIVVLGLLWCNAGVAEIYKLEKCYITGGIPADKFFNEEKFPEHAYKEIGLEINTSKRKVKYYWTTKDYASTGHTFAQRIFSIKTNNQSFY